MNTNKNIGVFGAAALKWAAVPLLAFLLAGLVTRKLVPAKPGSDGEQFQRTMADSLQKLDSGDRAGALDGLVRAGNLAPNGMNEQTALIVKFQALGEHKLAAEAIERVLHAAPQERQTARSYASLGEYLLEHGDLVNARRILLGDLMVRWPDALETAYLQGAVALQGATGKDDIAAAAKQLQKCVALHPGHVPSKLQLGIAYEHLGEVAKAEPLLRQVLEKRPFDPVALYHLSEVLGQQAKTAEAKRYLEEQKRVSALQERRKQIEGQYVLKKYQPADLLELARIYEQFGEFAKTASTLRVYTHLKPADADGQRELARACQKTGDQEGARVATGLADTLAAAHRP